MTQIIGTCSSVPTMKVNNISGPSGFVVGKMALSLILFSASLRVASSFVTPSQQQLEPAFLSPSARPVRKGMALFSERSPSDNPRDFRAFSEGEGDGGLNPEENLLRASEFLLDDDDNDLHDRAAQRGSDIRRERLERESGTEGRFARHGDELWALRADMGRLSKELVDALTAGDRDRERSVRAQLLRAEKRDAELVYKLEMEALEKAEADGRMDDAIQHREEALLARSCVPHLNLEGLWVGKYGSHGYEMINVTYVGDTLVAFKVTGDRNVPKGEITFQANLAPKDSAGAIKESEALKPIVLTDAAAKKWGTKQLPRYSGLGQVAEDGFTNKQWLDGQLIVIGEDYFSFAFLPIGHQIFFGRPSAELSLKMLREKGMSAVKAASPPPTMDDDVSAMKEYATRCLEATTQFIEDDVLEGKADPFSCIWNGESTEECYFE